MKVLKEGTVKDGVYSGWVFDCEGGCVDLDEFVNFAKIKEKPPK